MVLKILHGEGKHHINKNKYKEENVTTWMNGGDTYPCHTSMLKHYTIKTSHNEKPWKNKTKGKRNYSFTLLGSQLISPIAYEERFDIKRKFVR